jgi:hypothetical protein
VTTDEPEFYQVLFDKDRREAVAPATAHQGPNKPYATAALTRELAELATTEPGRRNDQLNISAFNLAQLVAAGHLDHATTFNLLHTTALSIGLSQAETDATLRSAFAAGTMQPRVVSDLDRPLPAVTIVNDPGAAPADDVLPTLRERFAALDWKKLWADDTVDEWVLEPLIPARRLVALFSPPKVGKSLLMLELAVGVARGTAVLGTTPKPHRVLYVDFENDPRGDIRSRLIAMGFHPDDLTNLFYLSYPRLAWLDTRAGGLELLAVAQEYECTVIIIDTISRAVSGEENVNDTWLAFYRNTGQLLKDAGIATVRLDHTGKDETKGMRGGSAKYGDVDAVWSMTRLAEQTFRLECTANRLPITEKLLLVERRFEPHLHHHLTMKRTGDVWRDEEERIIAALDELDAPVDPSWGRGKARELLDKHAVSYTVKRLDTALRLRRERRGIVALPGAEDWTERLHDDD